jgi:hypothetical protein
VPLPRLIVIALQYYRRGTVKPRRGHAHADTVITCSCLLLVSCCRDSAAHTSNPPTHH